MVLRDIFFFFQAEDGIRDFHVTGVQTCALPICLDGMQKLHYPDYEVIVVSDGSTDAVPQIASEYDVRLVETENRGLGSARNTGLRAATGEIVAYTDDDTRPDVDWLKYLAHTFTTTEYAAVGGSNPIPPYARGVDQRG